jgi:putative ABC transport system substrate-binding protein
VRRREFITLLGGAAVGWPLAARAQRAGRLLTIGYLGSTTTLNQGAWAAVFAQRLRDLGWVEGQTVTIEYRWAEGRPERFAEIAAEFVRLKVDVIFAVGTEASIAARQATATIPIVFPLTSDPVAIGLATSLARPGGNATGLSNQASDLPSKRLGLLREVVPGLRRLAILANANGPLAMLEMRECAATASALGLDIVQLEVRRTEDIASRFAELQGRADALYVVGDPLANLNRVRINTFALVARLPTMNVQREYVETGGLMSYGPNYLDMNRRAGDYVDRVLRGAKPADLPIEQPTKFDLVLNLTTAKALGITVPPTLLARADEVIE